MRDIFQVAAADEPSAALARYKGNPRGTPWPDNKCIEPVGIPAVVEIVQQPKAVAVYAHDVRKLRAIDKGQTDRSAGVH